MPKLRTDYKHIRFAKMPASGKTGRWFCFNSRGVELGQVYWYFGWRRYVFDPTDSTEFDASCLLDIADFLMQLKDGYSETD